MRTRGGNHPPAKAIRVARTLLQALAASKAKHEPRRCVLTIILGTVGSVLFVSWCQSAASPTTHAGIRAREEKPSTYRRVSGKSSLLIVNGTSSIPDPDRFVPEIVGEFKPCASRQITLPFPPCGGTKNVAVQFEQGRQTGTTAQIGM